MQQSQQTLLCLPHTAQHMAATAVVELSIGKHLLHVGEELLDRSVVPTRAFVLHGLEVHGVIDHIVVVLSLVSGHRLPEGPAEAVLHQFVEDFLTFLQLQTLPPRATLGLKYQFFNFCVIPKWGLWPRSLGRT